ncbi:hypothetical protein [Parendozoicomonas sp. Alg238-R29]|uniref:hypothetical protein n=1 Tax=Parendozoicomonas sp. Alg238-R29 TaxID=2993446 RepID=UPI00248E3359|nr:hypothetical protein [Parendozoicomonas sp. Alg238-R29]
MDKTLDPHVLDHLLQTFEYPVPRRRISEFRYRYPDFITTAILESGAYTPRGVDPDRLIKTDSGEDGGDGYRTVWEEDGKHYYYVPGLEPIEVCDDDLRVYDFHMDWFPDWMSRQIGNDTPEVLQDGLVWYLGQQHGTAIILVRGLGDLPRYEKIYDVLEEKVQRPALLLSRSPLQSKRLPLPDNHQVVLFGEIFHNSTELCLKKWLTPNELVWNPETGELRWNDLPPLKGKGKRREIYGRLYEAGHDYGQPKLNTAQLFEKVGIKPMTIKQYFSGADSLWSQYIGFDEENCWLRHFVETP